MGEPHVVRAEFLGDCFNEIGVNPVEAGQKKCDQREADKRPAAFPATQETGGACSQSSHQCHPKVDPFQRHHLVGDFGEEEHGRVKAERPKGRKAEMRRGEEISTTEPFFALRATKAKLDTDQKGSEGESGGREKFFVKTFFVGGRSDGTTSKSCKGGEWVVFWCVIAENECLLSSRFSFLALHFSVMSITEVRNLPLREKLQILEVIWEDLSIRVDEMSVSPAVAEHLDQRIERLRDGSAEVRDWDTVKFSIGKQ